MELFGISLYDIGCREGLRRCREYLVQGGLNTAAYICGRKLLEASENEEQQRWWKGIDLTFCEDIEILKALGELTEGRLQEIEENLFLKAFLLMLAEHKDSVFLLEHQEASLGSLETELKQMERNLLIIGRDTLERYADNAEGLINAMNALAPKVILSRLPYPEGIRLMYEYRSYLNASLWLTLPDTLLKGEKEGWKEKVSDLICKTLLHKKIHQFVQEQKEK